MPVLGHASTLGIALVLIYRAEFGIVRLAAKLAHNWRLVLIFLLLGYGPDVDLIYNLPFDLLGIKVAPFLAHRGWTHSLLGVLLLARLVFRLQLWWGIKLLTYRMCTCIMLCHLVLDQVWDRVTVPGGFFSNVWIWIYCPGCVQRIYQKHNAAEGLRDAFGKIFDHLLREFADPWILFFAFSMFVTGYFLRRRQPRLVKVAEKK